jgi:hypothetical protein
VDGPHGRPDPLDLLEGRRGRDVAGVDDEVRAPNRLDARSRKRAPPARQVGVGDDR